MSNKVKFGLKNVHVALLTEADDGTYSYATPVAVPGAVSMSLSAVGEVSPFYADDIVYYRSKSNNGYEGDLEMALITDWVRQNLLGETLDSKGVLVERSTVTTTQYFALLFEFTGDANKIRHVMYKCSASRPDVAGQTKTETIEPQTETLSLTADALEDGLVKSRTSDSVDTSTYNSWYEAVYIPDDLTNPQATNPQATPSSGN